MLEVTSHITQPILLGQTSRLMLPGTGNERCERVSLVFFEYILIFRGDMIT
jgi:hypothetical protein